MWSVIEKKDVTSPETFLFDAMELEKPYPYARFYFKEESDKAVIRVSPLSINATHNDALVTHLSTSLEIDNDDYQTMTDILSLHFKNYGFTLIESNKSDWLLLGDTSLISTPMPEILHHSIFKRLPRGETKAFWHRLFTECQMLCETLPFQTKRMSQGKPPINGLWFWGESDPFIMSTHKQFVTDDEALIFWLKKMNINYTLYDKTSMLSKIDKHKDTILYVDTLSVHHKKALKKQSKRIKTVWHSTPTYSDALKGYQDEDSSKKKNKKHRKLFRHFTTISAYLQRTRA